MEDPDSVVPYQRQQIVYDGRRMRSGTIKRRTTDFNSSAVKHLKRRIFSSVDDGDEEWMIQPDSAYIKELSTVFDAAYSPARVFTTRHCHTSINKARCPINCCVWTPEGRRLVTGASSGEFTLWNGLCFNFETILQAHDTAVRAMKWTHSDQWLISADHGGMIKYWQSSYNNVKAFRGHKEAVRDLCFAPTDNKLATCSDDGTIRIWDFAMCMEERVLTGHGWDVKCIDWHPRLGCVVSGSKDNLIKLWDPRDARELNTLHGHKNTIIRVKWNMNGNWLLSCSRDQLIKLFDVRMMKEVQTFKGHKKEVTSIAWHPYIEQVFVSGGFEGSILFWTDRLDTPQAELTTAHESGVWSVAWHPLGHILASGSNDHTTKFWTRPRPGEPMNDQYQVCMLPSGAEVQPEVPQEGAYSRPQAPQRERPVIPPVLTASSTNVIPGLGGV